MNWRIKAVIMRACDALPGGERLYRFIQGTFGTLDADPSTRLKSAAKMMAILSEQGRGLSGMRCMEVGTGHKPIAPIGLFLGGAASTVTVDLNRRLMWDLTAGALGWIADHQDQVAGIYAGLCEADALGQRLALVRRLKDDPRAFLEQAGITYLSPADAARTGLPPGSLDLHFSLTTLEHIPGPIILEIMAEARRVLAPDGLALHSIDLSDHFSHQDPGISAINFLRFSPEQWDSLAGNQFAYTNRLRASEYLEIFELAGFEVLRQDPVVDGSSLAELEKGFVLDPAFNGLSTEEICTTHLNLVLGREPRRA